MGQGIGAADDFLKVGLDPLRLVEPACFQTVLRLILVRRDVDNIVLRFFRFCRSFRHNCLFLNGRSGFFLLHRLFCATRSAENEYGSQSGRKKLFHIQTSCMSAILTQKDACVKLGKALYWETA